MLKYEEFEPSYIVKEYVECYWTIISEFSLHNELSLPDGSASLIVNFGSDYFRANCHQPKEWKKYGHISMPHQGKSSVLITQEAPIKIIGVRYKPYGLTPLYGISMGKLTPPFILQGQQLKPLVGHLEEIFGSNLSLSDMIQTIDAHLLSTAKTAVAPDPLVKEAVSIMIKNGGNIKISELYESLCMSKSSLEKKFQEHVGLSPKILCNIFRFNNIVYNREQDPIPSLTELSYNNGFFDQSHLVHNFRSFTGIPPGRFFKQENKLVEMLRHSHEARMMGIY